MTGTTGVGQNRGVSRTSDYSGADVEQAVARLAEQGIDAATVSLACALGHHGDCDGTVGTGAKHRRGIPATACACPECGEHRRPRRPRRTPTATT